jgi:hypothetical protein
MVVVKKYSNNPQALHFFKLLKKRGVPSPYEKLRKASLWDWFKPNGEVKPNYIHVAKLEITIKQNKINLLIFEKHPKLQNALVSLLQKCEKQVNPFLLPPYNP